MTSFTLLIVYLAFFHVCLGANPSEFLAVGIKFWLLWSVICIVLRKVFLNRFEFAIHMVVGTDLLFEGFSPLHEGYGFYICCACFWAVLWGYHAVMVGRRSPEAPTEIQPVANAGSPTSIANG